MTDLVAAFPMYNRPELRVAFDMLWEGTRNNLRAAGVQDVPDCLTVVEEGLLTFWQRPDLLLSQTCGFPYRHFLKDSVALVGTPDFGLEGCPPGYYRSALVVRRDDPRETLAEFQGATLAVNDLHSQSGYAAPLVAIEQAGLRMGAIRMSGAHVASARMVAVGDADIAGLDAVSWRHMLRLDAWTCGLRVIDWTPPTPGLPYITAFAPLAVTITACLAEALRTLPPTLRDDLTMKGLVAVDRRDYLIVADPEAPEKALFRT
ncbi:phosphate/phosphite/phosphonate ABC transporter substrate-binding protein [Fuscovulum ytuae]|uniref:PhnD/SsuA/transferrin family substrate-binding protein n=1 Tax=Fuscovulum ytuae TaxID=3042299 RepID=A0ABY8QDR3_9RHOB|nr:PhnD/SsuA/transferrin family substrate-binding protein [Fuscovulum sp. YMD61]WGV18390.1 PhnD/SsuA/transferrin family substrate-binding protein [Fuscovulum sp. YMD61]